MYVGHSQSRTSKLTEAPPWVRDLWQRTGIASRRRFHMVADPFEGLVTSLAQESGSAAAFWHVAEWDTKLLGVKCAKVDAAGTLPFGAPDPRLLARLFWELRDRARQDGVENLFYRVPADDLTAVRAAEEAGFRRIGTHLEFIKNIDVRGDGGEPPPYVRPAGPGDVDAVARLAELFDTGRFHRDGGFDAERVATLWRTSASNALQSWADAVYVYEASNRPVGFVILTRGEAGDAERIFLIAVAPEARGRGVGKALINTAVRHCRRKGMPLLRVGTQSSNKAAVARYESCEFSLERTYCELSWWLNEHS